MEDKKNVKEDKKKIEKDLTEVLYKKAVGYSTDEIVEEYVLTDEGDYKLNKRKITKKHISPDLNSAKILLEHLKGEIGFNLSNMTDEELEKEKLRLLKMLKE